DVEGARQTMETLAAVGISMKQVTDDLIAQAVKLFAEPFDKLLNVIDAKCKLVSTKDVNPIAYKLPEDIQKHVQEAMEDWKMTGKVRRLWARDASLWSGTDEASWLGWLGITEDSPAVRERFASLAAEVKSGGFKHALLLGMGGSSLCPEV